MDEHEELLKEWAQQQCHQGRGFIKDGIIDTKLEIRRRCQPASGPLSPVWEADKTRIDLHAREVAEVGRLGFGKAAAARLDDGRFGRQSAAQSSNRLHRLQSVHSTGMIRGDGEVPWRLLNKLLPR